MSDDRFTYATAAASMALALATFMILWSMM